MAVLTERGVWGVVPQGCTERGVWGVVPQGCTERVVTATGRAGRACADGRTVRVGLRGDPQRGDGVGHACPGRAGRGKACAPVRLAGRDRPGEVLCLQTQRLAEHRVASGRVEEPRRGRALRAEHLDLAAVS